jgi:large subunit ribosomal protein L1
MGTTRIKVIDLSTGDNQLKTSRKRAERGLSPDKIKKVAHIKAKKPAESQLLEESASQVENTEIKGGQIAPLEKVEVDDTIEDINEEKKASPRKKTKSHSKKYREAQIKIDKSKFYNVADAVEMVKQVSISKFGGSVEAHFVLTSQIKGKLALPHPPSIKTKKILIFAKNAKGSENIIAGDDGTVDQIKEGKLTAGKDFQAVFATADFMPKLAGIATILGPKGLMPNPKNGTVIEDPAKVSESDQTAQTEYKTEPKAPILHITIGKISQKESEISANLEKLITQITPQKIKKAYLAPTMGPSVKLQI